MRLIYLTTNPRCLLRLRTPSQYASSVKTPWDIKATRCPVVTSTTNAVSVAGSISVAAENGGDETSSRGVPSAGNISEESMCIKICKIMQP